MTIIYVTANNCEHYGVTSKNNGYVKVQKFEDISIDENTIYCVKPMRIFLGKAKYVIWLCFRELLIKKFLMEILFCLK